jgi:manganese efflux pump family protein
MAVAALVTWVITAGLGFFMLGTWIRQGGIRTTSGEAVSTFPPPAVFGHFGLAAAGLVLWIVYVINDAEALPWIAFVDLLVVAGIGDVLVLRWLKGRRASAATPEQRIPTPAVVTHGVFAVATLVLVLLAALGVGGS